MGGKERVTETIQKPSGRSAVEEHRSVLAKLGSMSGSAMLNEVLDREKPHELVRALSCEDFYWLVKQIGEDDCLPLVVLASEEQWQFLLDLDLWTEDRLDEVKTFQWISRLQRADLMRVARWLLGEGQALGYMYFFRNVEVVVNTDEDVAVNLPEGFVTLDGVYYFRSLDRSRAPEFETLLKAAAAEDRLRFQAMLAGLSGFLPAEAEEEMYRLRGVRLAEHGFLPREEALSVYSPLPVTSAAQGTDGADVRGYDEWEVTVDISLLPLMLTPAEGKMFNEVTSRIDDPAAQDRIRLEFSGLCNLIMSADRTIPGGMEDLKAICRKAAGYVNVAIEHLCGNDISLAVASVRKNALVTLFRIGIGLAMDTGRRAARWSSGSWWKTSAPEFWFWGDVPGKILQGLLQPRPLYYSGGEEGEEFRDFQSIDEVRRCSGQLEKIIALDSLLARLDAKPQQMEKGHEITVQALLITFWARSELGLEHRFSPISFSDARKLLSMLKGGVCGKKWLQKDFRTQFTRFFESPASFDSEADKTLTEALSEIWDEFLDEYRGISAEDLDPRFSELLVIEPSREAGPE
jgi:hypothetical protein